MDRTITFHPFTEADLPIFHEWLTRPHVRQWWGEETLEEVRAAYLPLLAPAGTRPLDAPGGVLHYVVREGDTPVGFIQAYRVMAPDHAAAGWWADETDPFALGIDQFIALPDRLGQGLGTRMIRAFLAWLFEDPRVTKVQTDPDPTNARAVACYRKAGFRDVRELDTPDGRALLMVITRAEHEAGAR